MPAGGACEPQVVAHACLEGGSPRYTCPWTGGGQAAVTGALPSLVCGVCGVAPPPRDTDARPGHFGGVLSFGPNALRDEIDESNVTEYRVYPVDAWGRRLGPAAAAVRRDEVDPSPCCNLAAYSAPLLAPTAAGFEGLLVVVVIDGQEMPTGEMVSGLRDVGMPEALPVTVERQAVEGWFTLALSGAGAGDQPPLAPPAACHLQVAVDEALAREARVSPSMVNTSLSVAASAGGLNVSLGYTVFVPSAASAAEIAEALEAPDAGARIAASVASALAARGAAGLRAGASQAGPPAVGSRAREVRVSLCLNGTEGAAAAATQALAARAGGGVALEDVSVSDLVGGALLASVRLPPNASAAAVMSALRYSAAPEAAARRLGDGAAAGMLSGPVARGLARPLEEERSLQVLQERLFAVTTAGQCAEALPLVDADPSPDGPAGLSVASRDFVHSHWRQVIRTAGAEDAAQDLEIEWRFERAKTLRQRFADAAGRGEAVTWLVSAADGSWSLAKNGTWRFSKASGLEDLDRWAAAGPSVSVQDGAWGAGSAEVDGNNGNYPADFVGVATFLSTDSNCGFVFRPLRPELSEPTHHPGVRNLVYAVQVAEQCAQAACPAGSLPRGGANATLCAGPACTPDECCVVAVVELCPLSLCEGAFRIRAPIASCAVGGCTVETCCECMEEPCGGGAAEASAASAGIIAMAGLVVFILYDEFTMVFG